MTSPGKQTTIYEIRRNGWTHDLLLAALQALRPANEDSDGEPTLGAEFVEQMLDAVQASSKDGEIARALNNVRIPGVSPRMLSLARALSDGDGIAQVQQICSDPVDALIEMLEEVRPEDRSDRSLEEFDTHLIAIEALAALGTPKALRFLVAWLPYTEIDERGERGPCAALEQAGEMAHAAIVQGWATLTWSWRAALLESFARQGGIRHETILQSFAMDLQQIDWDERQFYAWAAAGYGDPQLIPRVEALLDLCLDEFDPESPWRFLDIDVIAIEVLELSLGTKLSPDRSIRVQTIRERVAQDPKFGWLAEEPCLRWS